VKEVSDSGVSQVATGAKSEYQFYQNIANGVTPYAHLIEAEKTLYSILQQKVAYGGLQALNTKALQSIGQVFDKKNSLTYQSAGERINPVIVSSMQEAQQRVGSAKLVNTDHANNSKLPSGLFRDTGQNRYYLILQKTKPKSGSSPITGSSPTFTPTIVPPVTPPPIQGPTGGKNSFPKSKPSKPPKDDLIFNSADYQSTYEEAITQMSLALIASGDDIISNYSYESIDSLPDYDVEIEISGGEYLNAREVIEKGLLGGEFQSLIDDSTSSEELEKANKLLEYLEGKIGIDVSYSEILKYFGSFNADNVTFNSGVRKKTSDSPDADFYIEIPDEYQIAGVNEVRIRFDLI
jgi:hypothetical protein